MRFTFAMRGPFPTFPLIAVVVPHSLFNSLDCLIGGFLTLQHNEVRDLAADCLKEARFPGVTTEPELQILTGESFKLKSTNRDEDARSDVKCVGFWRRLRQPYFDIKVLAP